MSQYEDNRARWTVCTASPLVAIWQSTKLFPVPVGSTLAVWIDRELFAPLKSLPNQLTRSPVKKRAWIIYSRSEVYDVNLKLPVCICLNRGGTTEVLSNGLVATGSAGGRMLNVADTWVGDAQGRGDDNAFRVLVLGTDGE